MKALSILLLGLLLAAVGCSRQDAGTSELVRELRAMRGTLERMQSSPQAPARIETPAAPDVGALQQALEPLRELIQTLLTEQEALRGRQDALANEMSRWAQLVAPALQGGPAADLQALQDRLQKLEEELRAQETRHREVQDLLLRAMNSTSERLEAFLKTLGELRAPGTGPGEDTGRPPPADPGRESAEPEEPEPASTPGRSETESSPPPASSADGTTTGRTSRAGAEPWTPWVLLAGGALTLLFLWRLWREPDAPPIVQPAAEQDIQDWWVVVEELAQAMGVQPGGGAQEPSAVDAFPQSATGATRDEDVGGPVPDSVAQQLELSDPEAAADAETRATPQASPARSHTDAPDPEAAPTDPGAPVVLEWNEPCADPEDAAERLRSWLLLEPRVLLRPPPRIDTAEGRVSLRAWVMGDLSAGERRHLWTAARQVLHAGGGGRAMR